MAGKARYVKVVITSDAKSLAGYTVLGDVAGSGGRVLVLERPEQASAPRKKVAAKKAAPAASQRADSRQTSFDVGAMAPQVANG